MRGAGGGGGGGGGDLGRHRTIDVHDKRKRRLWDIAVCVNNIDESKSNDSNFKMIHL